MDEREDFTQEHANSENLSHCCAEREEFSEILTTYETAIIQDRQHPAKESTGQ